MSAKDYSRHRDRLAVMKAKYAPDHTSRDMDDLLASYGYPATPGTWARLMYNTIPTRHLVISLADAFKIDPYVIIPKVWFLDLEDCRVPTCPEHDQRIPERPAYT
jgi:hypothetical protein